MSDSFKIHTPTSGTLKKGFLLVFLLLIVLFVGLFVWKFAEALLTLRYGDAQERQALQERAGAGFTLAPELKGKNVGQNSNTHAKELIRSHTPVFGTNKAPLTLVAFIDFECPYCQKSYPVLKDIMERYDGVVQLAFKHFPVESLHPQALQAGMASACAQEQGKFWEYFDALFQQKKFDEDTLLLFADQLELNMEIFALCMSTGKYKQNIAQDVQDGIRIGIRGTPTFVLEDRKIEGALDKTMWDQIILNVLQKKTSNL